MLMIRRRVSYVGFGRLWRVIEMAGKPKITLSALKCDAFLNLKRQLASKDKELAKALQDNKMCAEHMNAQDAEIVKLEKENAALTAKVKELEVSVACATYNVGEFKWKEDELRELTKERDELRATIANHDFISPTMCASTFATELKVRELSARIAKVMNATCACGCPCCATVRKALKALEG